MENRNICLALGLSSFLSVSAGAMNLFTNPSFENGSGAATFSGSSEFGGADALELTSISSEIPDWTWEQNGQGGAAWIEEAGDMFGTDGMHLLYLDTNQSIQWQDVGGELVAGQTYVFDYNFASWERGQDNAPGGASSGTGTIFLDYNYNPTVGDRVYAQFSTDIRPPENMDSGPGALAWLMGSENLLIPADYGSDFNFSISTSGGMLIDELGLSLIPEPGTLGLVGLALVLFGTRRSRR